MSEILFPAKLKPLFEPRRYKVMFGGRGGAKSWGVARALIIQSAQTPLRILCAREVQKSMRDSVYRLLKDQIEAMGYGHFFDVLDTEIRGKNGSLFLFSGLQSHTVDSIKSFEGVNRVWVEEGHGVSKKSWDTLIPTIRAPNSEIWVTMNPDMDTDDTYQRFIAAPSPDTWLCEVNWRDNPWFPAVLEQERLKAQRADPESYEHIWEGKPRRVAEGAIYRHEVDAVYADGRVCPVPYDPTLPVHTVWDLGWNDAMVIIFVQRGLKDVRIIDHIEESNRTLDWYVAQLDKRAYRYGTDYIPHDGRARNFQTGKSTEELLGDMGRKVAVLPMSSIEEGIKAARLCWPLCYFDQAKAARLLECLKRYRREVNQRTGEADAPRHDEFSHSCLDGETLVLTRTGDVRIRDVRIGDEVWTPAGYAAVLNSGPTKTATDLIEITMANGTTITATPEHKFFTTRGVVYADALRCTDSIFTKESSPCMSYQSIKSAGYRDAVIGSFRGSVIGSGQPEASMAHKLAAKLDCFILRFTKPFMGMLKSAQSRIRSMATLPIQALTTGLSPVLFEQGNTRSKSSMESCSTGSQKAITKQSAMNTVESACTATFGSSTTVQYQAGSTFITKMRTRLTTALITSKCYLHQITPAIIQNIANGLGVMRTKLRFSQQASLQKSGTQAMTGRNGILNMQSRHGREESGTSSIASNVALSSLLHIPQGQSIAMPIAKLRRFAGQEAKRLVYDLTVEKHHCYLANGLLVSNSDAFRYVGQAVGLMSNGVSSSIDAFKSRKINWR